MDLLAILLLILSLFMGSGTGLGLGTGPGAGLFPPLEPQPTPTPSFGIVGHPTATPEAGSTTWIPAGVQAGKVASTTIDAQAGETITIQYEVAEHDIRAYLNLPTPDGKRERTGLCVDESGAAAAALPKWHQVQECRTQRGSARVEVLVAGEYRLEFDNSYSYFAPKKIRYRFHTGSQ